MHVLQPFFVLIARLFGTLAISSPGMTHDTDHLVHGTDGKTLQLRRIIIYIHVQ